MANRNIRTLERRESVRTVRGWCLGLGIVVWAMALLTLPIALGNPGAIANSVIPALASMGALTWLLLPLALLGGGLFLVALVLTWILQE